MFLKSSLAINGPPFQLVAYVGTNLAVHVSGWASYNIPSLSSVEEQREDEQQRTDENEFLPIAPLPLFFCSLCDCVGLITHMSTCLLAQTEDKTSIWNLFM